MRNLTKYVEDINRWAAIFGEGRDIDVNNLNEELAHKLFQRLEGDLSPENLCCDGELSISQVRRKAKMLHGAVADLKWLGYTPVNCYEI